MTFELSPERLASAGAQLAKPTDAFALANAVGILVQQCHGASLAAGWYTDLATGKPKSFNYGEKLMLCVSELAEAMEGHRKSLPDDKLPHRKMIEVELADTVIRICDHGGARPELELARATASVLGRPWSTYTVADKLNVPERLLVITKSICFAHGAHLVAARGDLAHTALYLGQALLDIGELCHERGYDLGGAIAEKMQFNAVRPDHKIEVRMRENGKLY